MFEISSIFNDKNSESPIPSEYLLTFLIALIIGCVGILFYLIYNAVCRYPDVIEKSLEFINKGKRNLSKTKFVIYSIIGSFLSTIMLCSFIYIIPKSITSFQDTIIYDPQIQIYGKVNYSDWKVIVIVTLYGLAFFYFLELINQICKFLDMKIFTSSPTSQFWKWQGILQI